MWAPNETNSRAILDAVNFTVVSSSTSISGASERKISLGSKTPGANLADEVVDFENPQLQSSLTNIPNTSTTTAVSAKTGKVFNLWSDENCETIWASCLDGAIRIWNGLEGRPYRMLKGHEEAITCLEGLDPYNLGYTSSSVLVATGSVDRSIRMWDLRTKKNQVFVFRGHGDNILTLRWSESGRALISGSKDKTIRIWDTRAGRLRTTIEKHFGSVHALRVIPDMTFSHPTTAGGNNPNSTTNSTTANTATNSKLHEQVAFVSAGRDSMINFWNANGDCISSQTAHRGYVSYLSDINYSTMNLRPTSANTSLLMLSVGSDNIIKLWDVKRCKCLSEITPTTHSGSANASGAGGTAVGNAASTPSASSTITKTTWCTGSSFVTASSNGQLRVFERTFDHYQNQPSTSHGLSNTGNGDGQMPQPVPTRGNTNSIEWSSQDLPSHSSSCTDIITGSNLLACGSKSGRILRWDW
jgi:WD40 repeat protein